MSSALTNYAAVLGVCPVETNRINVSIPSESGQNFDSTSLREITFLIRPSNFLDAQNSYLRFRAKVSATVGSVATVGNAVVCLDNPGAMAMFRKATLQSADGKTITEMDNLQYIALSRCRQNGDAWQSTVGRNMLGYSPVWEQNTGCGGLNGAVRCNKEIYDFTQSSAKYELPAYTFIPSGSVNTTVSGDEVEFAVPLSFFSGLFDPAAGTYLPLRSFSSRTHALQLTLTIDDAQQALVYCHSATNFASQTALDTEIAKSTYRYDILGAELITEWVELGAAKMEEVNQMVATTGISIKFSDYTGQLDNAWQSGTNWTSVISKITMSLKDVTVQIRDAKKLRGIKHAGISQTKQYSLSNFSTKIGNSYYPSAGIALRGKPSANGGGMKYAGSAYAETLKSSGGLCSRGAHRYNEFYHVPNAAAFEISVDYDAKERQTDSSSCEFESSSAYVISGKDTKSTAAACVFEYVRDTTTDADATGNPEISLSLFHIFHTDNVCVVASSGVSPLERP